MFNPNDNNQIVFPHIIPGNMLGGTSYTWNNVNGGVKPIGAFGLTTNTFLGGQCVIMGFVRELGLWACRDKNVAIKVRAFYMSNPDEVTPLGRKVISEAFPTKTVRYIMIEDIPKTPEDAQELARLRKEAIEYGYSPKRIDNAKIESLKSLIEVAKFEQAQEKSEKVEEDVFEEALKESVKQTPQDVMAKARAAKKAKQEET